MSDQPTLKNDRRQSGVTRSITAWTAFLFGLHCISLSSSGYIPFSWVASVWPGASIVGVLLIGVALCLVHGKTYALIGTIMPVEGADYWLASRTISPNLAFAASWTLVLFSGVVAGGLAAWVPKSALPALLRPMAILLHQPAYAQMADVCTSPTGTVLIGSFVVLVALVTTLRTESFLKPFLNVGLFFGLVAWAIILYSLASANGPESFRDGWNRFMSSTGAYGAFDARLPLALKAGMHISRDAITMTLAGLIMGFWIYYGYYIPTFFSEEVQQPSKSLWRASSASLLVACLLFVSADLLLERLVPSDWIAAEGFLFNNPDVVTAAAGNQPVVAMPWITFYAAILKPVPILIYLVALGWIVTLINLVQTYLFYTSRIIYSWALDRVVPDWVVGRKVFEPSPSRSLWVTAGLAFVGLIDSVFSGPLSTQLTFVFFVVATSLVPVFALTMLPKLGKSIFANAPPAAQKRTFGIPVISLYGAVTFIYLVWMVLASFLFPAAGVSSPRKTLLLFAAFVASGFVVFTRRRRRLKEQGIDLHQTYRSSSGDASAPSSTAKPPDVIHFD